MNFGRPTAVTGLGCLCAAGLNLEECLDSVFQGRRDPKEPWKISSTHPVIHPVFEVPSRFFQDPHNVETEDQTLTTRFVLTATFEALSNAGWSMDELKTLRVGVCLGTTVGSAMNNEDFYRQFREAKRPSMQRIGRFLNNNPATAVARSLDVSGPCQTVVNACSSGTDAIGIGSSWIQGGDCDVVIAGGTDELCRVTYNGFISLMIADTGPCKPFDRNRRGLNLGEGAGVLVLESDQIRAKRRKKARGFVLGYGSSCDAYHLTAPHPQGLGLKRALTDALVRSGVTSQDIAFVNAHGTGTPDNDRVESLVLREMLPGVPFLSTKGYTGHTLGAAGGIEAVFSLASLESGKIPASIGFSTPDPELQISPVADTTKISGRAAISQSLAFGGNNGVLVFGRAD